MKFIRHYKPDGIYEDIAGILSFELLQSILNGYIQVVRIDEFSVICDEEGRLKGLPYCCQIGYHNFVGDIFVGNFTDNGLEPINIDKLEEFQSTYYDI